jgi:adenylosuccinate lyase
VTLDFALARLTGRDREALVVYPDRMRQISTGWAGCAFAAASCSLLTRKGVSREDAYALVQRNAMKVWEGGGDHDCREFRQF